ncbi:Williams-Beuren syndrome chromosomal region 27 protein-like isoform X2 [Mizuhopecten yessoensis]|uniref:Williams-Beuren syndrome chromosomal region 27 protein-like isoform X2 n=1 Tax=Mizuhopecten yessoensis TaxID=6573 RepID=UPI000B4598DC|nr:Williams-Beuren syndrome chromosomal region 27 protein-like isoform X2 [Mizuhopecten yessoensis]
MLMSRLGYMYVSLYAHVWVQKLNMNATESCDKMGVNSKIKDVYTPGRTKEEVIDSYNNWADTYEHDLNPDKFRGPVLAANECCAVIPEKNRMSALVLDLAAGTGFLGKELHQKGFKNLHALDPSTEMLEKARARNVYQKFIIKFISEEEELPVNADTYDIVVSSGGMGQGHIPAGALLEMLRITRKGGYIIWSMREEYLRDPQYDGILEALIDNMEESGKWSKIKKRVIPNYYEEKEGAVFVFKKI